MNHSSPATQPKPRATFNSSIIFLAIILLGTILIFAPGVTASFSSDDYVHLSRNQGFSHLGDALSVFSKTDGREYRPLVRLSLWLNGLMTETALSFKVTNLFLHLLVVCLIFFLLRALRTGLLQALLGAALFALHPIHTTSVHFIMGRTDLLASVFYLAALLSMLRWRRQEHLGWFFIALFWTLAALASKELAVTLPVMMLLLWWSASPPGTRTQAARDVAILAPFFVLTLAYAGVRIIFLPDAANIETYTNFSLSKVTGNYIEWTFAVLYPFDLYYARHALETRSISFLVLTALAAIVAVVIMLLWLWPQRGRILRTPLFWLGIAWFVITLLPMAGGNAHRWYLYLPSAGLAMIFGALCQGAGESLSARRWTVGIVTILFSAYAIETSRQSEIWRQQHQQSELFFEAVESSGLLEQREAYLANIPFGYKSAFLFSFDSLQYALQRRYTNVPQLFFLSYTNLDEESALVAHPEPLRLTLSLTPGPFEFLLLPPAQRRLTSPATLNIGDWIVSTTELAPSGGIRQLTIEPLRQSEVPVYFFDGTRLRRLEY